MISHTQTLEGITSRIPDDPKERHIILWDLEKKDGSLELDEVLNVLAVVQFEFKLGDIFIVSDRKGSFRAFCFSRRTFLEYVHILIHTFPLVDFGFFIWTVRRVAGTLRLSQKEGRPPQKVVAFLKGYEETGFPEKLVHVIYDTGVEKRGRVVNLGSGRSLNGH